MELFSPTAKTSWCEHSKAADQLREDKAAIVQLERGWGALCKEQFISHRQDIGGVVFPPKKRTELRIAVWTATLPTNINA